MDERLRRPLVGLGVLAVLGNVLGLLLYAFVRVDPYSASGGSAEVLVPVLVLSDVVLAVQVAALAAAVAAGWFVARGPGGWLARAGGALLAGAAGAALLSFFGHLSILPAFEAAYPELGPWSWEDGGLLERVGLAAAAGAAGGLTGALAPLADERLAGEPDVTV